MPLDNCYQNVAQRSTHPVPFVLMPNTHSNFKICVSTFRNNFCYWSVLSYYYANIYSSKYIKVPMAIYSQFFQTFFRIFTQLFFQLFLFMYKRYLIIYLIKFISLFIFLY